MIYETQGRDAVREAYDVIHKYGCRMLSLVRTIHDESGKRHVYIRACDCNQSRLTEMIGELKKVSDVLYLVDMGDGKRELYREYDKPKTEWFVG